MFTSRWASIRDFHKRFFWSARAAVVVLLTAAVTWVWAHEGHAPLPTKGATPIVENGVTTGVYLSKEARDALGVSSALVQNEAVHERVLAYATLEAPWRQHAFATARIPGRISALHVKPGQAVAMGQLLAEVESLELESLQLEALNADNDVSLATRTVEQVARLVKERVISDRDLSEAQAKHRESLNALAIARGKWLSLGLSSEDFERLLRERNPKLIRGLPIASPISGAVIHADVAVGRVIEPTEHLFEIVDLSTVWVKVGVLERDLHKVQAGQAIELVLAAYPSEPFTSKVEVKGLYLDPQTHLGTAWGVLVNLPDKEPRFLPGMHGQAQIVVAAEGKGLTVPTSALVRDGAEHYVLVEQEATAAGSRFVKESVSLAGQEADVAAVAGRSLFPGDKVVTTGSHELATFFVQGVLRLSPQTRKSIGLRIEPVQVERVEDVVEVNGVIDVPPDSRAAASSQLTGNLQKILVERGQSVRAGDVLAEIASLELQNLQLELIRAQLQLDLLQNLLPRLRTLEEAQILARRRLWEAESQHNGALNRRESLRRKLVSIGLSEDQVQGILNTKQAVQTVPLRAPIDGVVVHFDRVLGQTVKANETLFEIHDLSRAWVQGFLSERDVPFVRLGQSVRVRLVSDPNRVLLGKVVRSGQVIGTESRTLAVWVELNEPPKGLQHNMLAQLDVAVGSSEPTLAVPRTALVLEGTRAFAFIEKPDGTFERRSVHTGKISDRYAEVRSGLGLGEMVVVAGVADLQTAYASIR